MSTKFSTLVLKTRAALAARDLDIPIALQDAFEPNANVRVIGQTINRVNLEFGLKL